MHGQALLSTLSLSACELHDYPDLAAVPSLTTLDLSSNHFEHFSTSLLQGCARLQRCNMTSNPLISVHLDVLLPVMARLVLSELPPETQVPLAVLSSKSSRGIVVSRKQTLLSTHSLWREVQASCQPKLTALTELATIAAHNTHVEASAAVNKALSECFPSPDKRLAVEAPPARRPYVAARIIQATWRGYHLRSRLTEILARAMQPEEGANTEDTGLSQDAFDVDDEDFGAAPPKYGVSYTHLMACVVFTLCGFVVQVAIPQVLVKAC